MKVTEKAKKGKEKQEEDKDEFNGSDNDSEDMQSGCESDCSGGSHMTSMCSCIVRYEEQEIQD